MLTDAKLRALKAKAAPYKVGDGNYLHVLVNPNGSRLWCMTYRYAGKQKSLAFGKYPIVSLLNARRARDDARRLLASGIDPSAHRKAERRNHSIAATNTFKAVADEWFELYEKRWVKT